MLCEHVLPRRRITLVIDQRLPFESEVLLVFLCTALDLLIRLCLGVRPARLTQGLDRPGHVAFVLAAVDVAREDEPNSVHG